MAIDQHTDHGAGPLHERILRAALSRRRDEDRDSPRYIRHAVWERLARPDLLVRFPVLWMDDGGRVRADRGFLAVYAPGGPCRGDILFRAGLTEDELCARTLLRLLESRLCAPAGGAVLCGVDRDPAPLSDGESMRLCHSLRDHLRRSVPALTWAAGPDLPDRERGYLGLPEAGWFDPARAVGYGLCYFAREALHRTGRGGLDGKILVLRGGGPVSSHAAECARRLGAQLLPDGSAPADLVFLCDREAPLDIDGAEALIARRPDGVFEGVPLACTPEAADRMARAGLLFAPAVAAGAGAFALPPSAPAPTSWEAERLLRTAMEAVLQTVRAAAPEDLHRGAYAAALHSAAEALVRRGI